MLKAILFLMLAVSCAAVVIDGCNSTSSQNSGSSPQPETRQEISGKPIWKGASGGFEIEWTTEDLFSRSGGKTERILQPLARRGYEEFSADVNRSDQTKGSPSNNCDYRRNFEVLSIVGSLVTFQDTEYSDCGGAHPSTEMRFTLIDLGRPGEVFYGQEENALDVDLQRPGKALKITDYFAESDILNALLADRVIKRALAEGRVSSPPQSLAALPELFAKNEYVLPETELSLRPDFLTRFAFHHIEGDMVALRLNLPSIAFDYRSSQIGLLLPIPARLKQSLALAATGQEGFLMSNAPSANRNQITRFEFKVGEGARR